MPQRFIVVDYHKKSAGVNSGAFLIGTRKRQAAELQNIAMPLATAIYRP